MVAKLLSFIVFLLGCAAAGSMTLGFWTNHVLFSAGFAAILVFGYSLILAIELVCLNCVEPRISRPALTDLVKAWWGETLTTPRIFYWRQPFRASAEPDNIPWTPDGHHGILLVHGLVCNRGFWNPWIRRLGGLNISCAAISLEPVFGPIESYAVAIEDAIRKLTLSTGASPVVVAHSMGGLAVRHWMRAYGGAGRIRRVITVGTPHTGTWMARFGHSPSGRQMAIDGDWLAGLAADTASGGHAAEITSFYGDCDNIVFPAANARLAGADNRCISCAAHVALAFHEDVFAEALRWLDRDGSDQRTRSVGSTSPGSSSPSIETRR